MQALGWPRSSCERYRVAGGRKQASTGAEGISIVLKLRASSPSAGDSWIDTNLRPECYPAPAMRRRERACISDPPWAQPTTHRGGPLTVCSGVEQRRPRFRLSPVKGATLGKRNHAFAETCEGQTPTSHQLETLVLTTADFACECGGSLEASDPRTRRLRMAGLVHLMAPSAHGLGRRGGPSRKSRVTTAGGVGAGGSWKSNITRGY